MKIKLIDFGVPEGRRPFRPHGNDAGADVYMPYDCILQPGEIAKVPLGFGIEVPDGYAGFVFPRTSMAVKGLVCELPPVDSGYRAFQRFPRGPACDYTGCDRRFCFGAWWAARHRRIWKYRKIKKCLLESNSGIIAGSGIGHIRRIAGYNKRKAAKGGTLS